MTTMAKQRLRAAPSARKGRDGGRGGRAGKSAASRHTRVAAHRTAVRDRMARDRNALPAGFTRAAVAGSPGRPRPDDEPEPHSQSATAVAAEALRTGVVPNTAPANDADEALPGEGRKMLVGDPDDDGLRNEYVGEDTPGGSTPTPDQSDVDEIGLAYGVKEEDSGELRTSAEVLDGRDRRRRGIAPKRRNL